jgi:RimJ/RimL family protein N-acetyltransferase
VQNTTLDYSRYFWQGEKIRLRPVRLEDAELFFAASLDSPARQVLQLGIELPTSEEIMRASLETYVGCKDADGVILFVIENLEGAGVGGTSLHSRDQKNGTFSFGIVVYPEHRRHGYAEDAARILLRYGFWERRYQKCDSGCLHTNEASIAFHKKLGFVEEGRRRRRFFLDGGYYDDLLFGLTREEFDAIEAQRPGTRPADPGPGGR